jgi:hypothetical protein
MNGRGGRMPTDVLIAFMALGAIGAVVLVIQIWSLKKAKEELDGV